MQSLTARMHRLVNTAPPKSSNCLCAMARAIAPLDTSIALFRTWCWRCNMERYWVTRAIREIELNFADSHLSLSRVAQKCGVSACHLSRELSRGGTSGFRVRVHFARTEAAHRLLLNSTLRIKEIAAAVGYANASHFRRAFAQSPTVLRNRLEAKLRLDSQDQGTNSRYEWVMQVLVLEGSSFV